MRARIMVLLVVVGLLAFLVGFGIMSSQRTEAQQGRVNYEYMVADFFPTLGVDINRQSFAPLEGAENRDQVLNYFGAEGWELVQVDHEPGRNPITYYFKRPIV